MNKKCSPEIRNKLSELVSPKNEDNWWKPDLFEKNVRHLLPKEIEVLEAPPQKEKQYNCFIFVLGLSGDERFYGNDKNAENCWFYALGINKLPNYPEEQTTPIAGDIIFYENERGVITHAGVMESSDTVISKWSWGPLMRHHIWCVPKHYGDKISFYKKLDASTLSQIVEFAENFPNG